MHEVCFGGNINVAKKLFEISDPECVRRRDSRGWTPMHEACLAGHMQVVQWLFQVGNVDDLLVRSEHGYSPIHLACHGGHLALAKWLFEEGASRDIYDDVVSGVSTLRLSCLAGHMHVVQWLLERGSGNLLQDLIDGECDDAHIDHKVLLRDIPQRRRLSLIKHLQEVLAAHDAFTKIVFLGTRELSFFKSETHETPLLSEMSEKLPALFKLQGHEETLIALIADFVGVPRGRGLRILRSATLVLEEIERLNKIKSSRDPRGTASITLGVGRLFQVFIIALTFCLLNLFAWRLNYHLYFSELVAYW